MQVLGCVNNVMHISTCHTLLTMDETCDCHVCDSSPLRHPSLHTACASQRRQRVLSVVAIASDDTSSSGTAETHVDGLAAGVHAADGGVTHASSPTVPTQCTLSALGRRAAVGGAPRQAVGGAGGGVDRAWAGGLWVWEENFIFQIWIENMNISMSIQ